ncbi:E3 ubiquitin-protein ligase RNF126 isoform X2 [Anopheles aquasalis]|uniref:E3 ubiquitin-protein ligase RNF126 isoform X2 n=1 Tax=Anopheles aquasalis TaxID=42839 RepID=UPI00215A20D3|nr:E3 ubiquitin-protein ligase RNF126 isoform X2 [Anopheles aquasalis]
MEAMVENSANPPPRFYCHSCSVEIDSVSSEFTCPHCSEGFIEELPAGERGAASSVGASGGPGPESDGPPIDYVNAQLNPDTIGRLAGELLSNSFLSPLYSIYDDEPAGGSGGSGTNSTSSSYVTFPPDDIPLVDGTGGQPTAATGAGSGGGVEVASGSAGTGANGGSSSSSSTGSGPSMHHRFSMGRPRGRRNITHLDHILREFFISVADGAPGGVPLFFMGNPGDYAWGREGIDSIVTQLLNQMDNTGPPPLEKERIAEIPTVAISEKQVEMKLQCSVCFEDFQVGESVRKLPCLHVYHEPCIIPWLELHGTCPSCRKSLTPESGSQQPGSQQATTTAQSLQQPEPMDTSQQQQQQQQQQQAVPTPAESAQSQQQPQQTQEPQATQPGGTPSQSAGGTAGRQNNPNFVAFTIRPTATVTTRYDPNRPSIFSSPAATGSRNASDASSQSSSGGGAGSAATGGPSSGSSTNNGSNATAEDDYFSLD